MGDTLKVPAITTIGPLSSYTCKREILKEENDLLDGKYQYMYKLSPA